MFSTTAAERRRSLRRRFVACSVAATFVFAQLPLALASDESVAQELFDQGKRLMGEKKFAEACNAFQESYRLDAKTGALLNLADCNEQRGFFASAWVQYKDVVTLSRKEGNDAREKYAREHATTLEVKLSRLTISLGKGSDLPDLEITVDGSKFGRAGLGVALPVDPGKHAIVVTASGRKPWRGEVEVGATGDKKTIEIPALAVDDTPKPPPATGAPAKDYTLPLIIGGVGVVALGVGIGGGFVAMSKWNDRKSGCPTDTTCTQAGVDADKSARTFAWVSDIGLGVGVVGIGVGVVLALLPAGKASEPTPKPSAFRVTPAVGSGFAGVRLDGSF